MKIFFWTEGFWPRIGGIETQAMQFIEEMQKRGHQYVVLAQKDGPDSKEKEEYNGITINRFDLFEVFSKRELKHLRSIELYLEWVVKEFQPDIIHLNTSVGWSAFVFLLFKKVFQSRVVLTVHSPFFYGNHTNPLMEKLSTAADQICCVSNWVLTETKRLIPTAGGKLKLIYNGLPMPEIDPSPLCFSPPTFLLLGRFTKEKGFDTAIRAFSLLKRGNSIVRLMIAGEGEECPSLEQLVDELGLRDSVEFTGGLVRDKVAQLMNRATIVIVPSYFESFGLVALEAMQMGRPVIASRVGGMQEVIADGKTGVLVSPQDPIVLHKAMEDLLKQPEKAQEMGIQGHKRAMERFTLHQNASQYEALYQELRGCPR